MTVVPTGFISVFTKKMKAITAVLVLGLLCGAEARWELRWHFGRNLLQVTPSETQPTAATIPLAAPNAAAVPPQTAQTVPATGTAAPGTVPGAVAAQPAAAAAVPAATTVPDTAAPGAVAAQPAAGTAATAPTATAPVTTAPAATAPVATAQPAADTTTDPAASPTLAAYPGRQGVYVIADPAPPPRAPAAPAAGTNATAAAADAGPPALAAGNNLIVVFTVMGEDAKTIYKNQQELRSQLATAAGVTPSQVLFYNQTANQDPRTGVTALSLSMAVDCGSPAVCARAGAALQNTTSQTKLSDGLAREGVSVMAGTFQVYGVNSFGRYKGNDTLYEDKNLFAPKPAAGLSYNETMARFGNASGAGGALPGTLPGMPLGNFSIPGFGTDNTTATAGGMQNGFNLSTFQIPQGLLPAGATPLGNATQQQPVAPLVRSSASGIVAGVVPVLLAAAAAMLM